MRETELGRERDVANPWKSMELHEGGKGGRNERVQDI